MEKTRLTADVDSEKLSKGRKILEGEQITLDEALEQMLSYIVSHGTIPCFECGVPNAETLQAMADAESGDLVSSGSIADLFANLNEED